MAYGINRRKISVHCESQHVKHRIATIATLVGSINRSNQIQQVRSVILQCPGVHPSAIFTAICPSTLVCKWCTLNNYAIGLSTCIFIKLQTTSCT